MGAQVEAWQELENYMCLAQQEVDASANRKVCLNRMLVPRCLLL